MEGLANSTIAVQNLYNENRCALVKQEKVLFDREEHETMAIRFKIKGSLEEKYMI